jgi:hypothetical protein
VVEFRTSGGDVLAISIPRNEAGVIRHFQERMPYGLFGQYDRPVRVLALNVEEGWVRDVSEIIAAKVQDVARFEEQELTAGTRAFVEAHSDPTDEQQLLPLWQ